MKLLIKQIPILLLLSFILISCTSTDYEKTITVEDLTNESWYLETSELKTRLNNYMESRGMYEDIYREVLFIGDGKTGSVIYFEKIRNEGESCRSEGRYITDESSGILQITITGLENSNGYCSYVSELNGRYTYKYMLMTDIDSRFNDLYSGEKTFTLSKGGRKILFQKNKK